MKSFVRITLAFAAWASTVAAAQSSPELNVYYETAPEGYKITAQLDNAPGSIFGVFAKADSQTQVLVGLAAVGSDLVLTADKEMLDSLSMEVELLGAFLEEGQVVFTQPADLVMGVATYCDLLDFNYTMGPDNVMVAGRVINEQWADMGMHVSAQNGAASHPDEAILFDTASPTGSDFDLATPNGAAVGNDTALGMVLIIAENATDIAPADGLVDDPDDEKAGGSIHFDFDDAATICSVTLLDIDETPGTELRFYRNGDLSTPDETLSILSLGDGSVQKVEFLEEDVDRFEVFFKGSGAIGQMELIPCPRVVNFDETSTGIPNSLMVGEWLQNQFSAIGLNISAVNGIGGHPNKAILFDSENPSGGDVDLLTPNPAVPGNDTPLGKVLIIAENDVDVAPADGLVDDPDDEAGGGVISFAFDFDVTIVSARVLDVDAAEVDYFRFYDAAGDEITSILIPDAPNGNVQLINAGVSGVRRVDLELGGSGAVTRLRFCPE